MKISELFHQFLSETPEDDQAINKIAADVRTNPKFIKLMQSGRLKRYWPGNTLPLGAYTDYQSNNPDIQKLLQVKIMPLGLMNFKAGYWAGKIFLDPEIATSTNILNHELRHALDHIKSDGKFINSNGGGRDKVKGNQHKLPAFDRPMEWNAFYAQITDDIQHELQTLWLNGKRELSPQEKLALIKKHFENSRMAVRHQFDVSDSKYRHLLTRLTKFLDHSWSQIQQGVIMPVEKINRGRNLWEPQDAIKGTSVRNSAR